MKTIGTGKVIVYTSNGETFEVEGEIEIHIDRLVVTEIIYINGRPSGARECNFPLSQCHIYWQPELHEEI